jgi:predicted enzyme related to lactoylglutathione lyase
MSAPTNAKVHLHMHVSDLAKSREFYRKFLGADPVKVKANYAKFLPDWAPVNLALSGGGSASEGTVNHVGVQVDAVDTVMAHLARVKAAGLPVREEMGSTADSPIRTRSGSAIRTGWSGRSTTGTTTSRGTRTRPRPRA